MDGQGVAASLGVRGQESQYEPLSGYGLDWRVHAQKAMVRMLRRCHDAANALEERP